MKTALLLGLLIAMVLVVGDVLGGLTGLLVALAMSVAMNADSLLLSDRLALRTVAAQPLHHTQAPELHAMVRELTAAAGQPMPRLYRSPVWQPNAFATGRSSKRAVVVVTEGILQLLTPRELRAALAHELSHVYNRDMLITGLATVLGGMVTAMANLAVFFPIGEPPHPLAGLLLLILGPLAAAVVRLAISRDREYRADADGATLSRDPIGLASALRKIDSRRPGLPTGAPCLMATRGLTTLFRTHPPTQSRVRRLRRLAASLGAWPV
jgi:heat shock protein HtpX